MGENEPLDRAMSSLRVRSLPSLALDAQTVVIVNYKPESSLSKPFIIPTDFK